MENVIKMNTMFRIAIKLQTKDILSLGLLPRNSLATTSHFDPSMPQTTPAPGHPVPVPASTPPPAAPNKLKTEAVLDQKNFNTKSVPALTKPQDIHRWYNVLHSQVSICGIYTTPWEYFTKASYMGETWTLASLDQAVIDMDELMAAALHGLL
jgi:hypothetical protein